MTTVGEGRVTRKGARAILNSHDEYELNSYTKCAVDVELFGKPLHRCAGGVELFGKHCAVARGRFFATALPKVNAYIGVLPLPNEARESFGIDVPLQLSSAWHKLQSGTFRRNMPLIFGIRGTLAKVR